MTPASKDDWWISDGFARYSEARYVESAAGEAGLEEMVKDMSVGALAYDSVPLSSADKLDFYSPEFQSLVTDKGADDPAHAALRGGRYKILNDHARFRYAICRQAGHDRRLPQAG